MNEIEGSKDKEGKIERAREKERVKERQREERKKGKESERFLDHINHPGDEEK